MAQPRSVVHILIPGKPPKHGLPQHSNESMPAVPASAGVSENLARHRAETEHVVELPVCEQSRVGRRN